jgi:hypothetical protein
MLNYPCFPPTLLHDEPVNITFRDFRLNVLVALECNIWRIGFGLVVKIHFKNLATI